jgi:hypothetical protein
MGFVLSSINEKNNHTTNWRSLLSSESRLLAFSLELAAFLCFFVLSIYSSLIPRKKHTPTLIIQALSEKLHRYQK